jgi:hypothetical protein
VDEDQVFLWDELKDLLRLSRGRVAWVPRTFYTCERLSFTLEALGTGAEGLPGATGAF